ncbi:MAG: MFS transporter [Clostridia bacterium]|nr:MFS transporter [Clostridia bacterium]
MKHRISDNRLGIFLMFAYMVSYLTRINFGAVIIEMVSATGFTKTQLSAVVTGSFITYGAGQVISGFFGDKIQPRRLVFIGLCVTVLMNFLVPFCPNPAIMTALWCVNGMAQAFMWPPVVKLMASLLSTEDYNRASATVSFGSAGGTILIYLLSPLIIELLSWKAVFWFSAVCGAVMAVIWINLCPEIALTAKVRQEKNVPVAKVMLSPMMVAILLAIVLQGMLRDGVTTWMPTFVSETFNLGSSVSILTGVLLPIFTVLSIRVSSKIYAKVFTNALTCSGVIFGAGATFALMLFLFTGKSAILSVLFIALLSACMHGVNFMLICIVPAFFKYTGCVSLISGILNAFVYIGSAASTYGIAVLTESIGWKLTVGIWFIVAAVGTASCLVCVPAWKRFTAKK